MKPLQIMFFTIMCLLFATGNFYVLYRLYRLVPPAMGWAGIAVIVCGVTLTASFFIAMFSREAMPFGLVSLFYRLGTSWIFMFLYLLMIFLTADLVRITRLLPMDNVMYDNMLTLGILAVAVAVIFIAGNINYHHKRRVELDIGANIPRPVKIVAASDLHLGYGIGPKELARWVDMINVEKPDVIVFAGDVADTGVRPLWQRDFAQQLRRLDAPLGVYMVPGNHEYISGIDESVRFMENAGITVLRDTVVRIADSFYIVGRDDASNRRRRTLAELTGGLPDTLPTMLLDHQPYRLEEAESAGVDLQISGHTHRGQVWPITWITDAMFERSHGYLRKGGTHYYIGSGLGIWGGKFRIGSHSEYIVVNFPPDLE